ncbi:hypothetical protein Hypma_015879 [Hypsizygus marmoreus]|uniref:F-box domain-containing protein n=1 Tax=Hypsizygus marmoreus TaxID=39966 RepID=A0A369K7M0_HYPMA|nr:hypothetical protein Hypma_015879 [Hypsizygus marmoreus]
MHLQSLGNTQVSREDKQRYSKTMSFHDLPATTDDLLLSGLETRDLVRYARVSPTTYSKVQSYYLRAFSIEKHLSPYFTSQEVHRFRMLQGSTGMLITGLSAIRFFQRQGLSPDIELELYVEHHFTLDIGRWFISVGYEYVSLRLLPIDFKRAYFEASTYIRPSNAFPRRAHPRFVFRHRHRDTVIIMATVLGSAMEPILNYPATCVMNIITFDAAVAFFPNATFVHNISLIMDYGGPNQQHTIDRYKSLGWTMTRTSNIQEFLVPFRWVGDNVCWTIPLSKTGLSGYDVKGNSWLQVFSLYRNSIMYSLVVSYRLRFTYTQARLTLLDVANKVLENQDSFSDKDVEFIQTIVKYYGRM